MPISSKDAVIQAQKYLIDLFGSPPSSLAIEEIERDGNWWKITLSYYESSGDFPFKHDKVYKEFKVNVDSGEILYMKIRKL